MKYLQVFTSPTCAPCKAMKPLLSNLGIPVKEVDIEADPASAARHRIRSVPTLKVYEDDCLIRTHAGALSRKALEEFVG